MNCKVVRGFYLLIAVFIMCCPVLQAETVKVSTIERPPFATYVDGEWQGFSVDLFKEIAKQSEIDYKFVEETVFADMIAHVNEGDTDLAVANISVTSEREQVMDFTQPIFESGLQIIVHADQASVSLVKVIWESGVIQLIGIVLIVLLIFAHLLWFFERNVKSKRHDYFRDDYFGGLWDAFWWAFIVATMGGFENERPERYIGRALAVFWVLASLFFMSTVTAKITSALTVSSLESNIQSYSDLYGQRVGAPKGTTISAFLDNNGIPYIEFDDFQDALKALESKQLNAVVGDAAVSQYYVSNQPASELILAGDVFSVDNIAFAFSENSEYFEAFNQALIRLKEDGTYADIRKKYFGE